MFISCVTAAPIRHPPGEANAAPRALPPPAWVAQVAAPSGYLGGAAARGSITRSPIEGTLSPRDNTTGDNPTPTSPTTLASCRQKRLRRHKASRDNIIATSLHQLSRQSTPSMSAKNYWQTLADTTELADMARLDSLQPHHQLQPSQQLTTSVAKNVFRDTMPPCDSVREDWTGSQDVADRQDQKKSDVPTRANPAFLHPVNPRDPVILSKKKTNQTLQPQQTYDCCRQKRVSRQNAPRDAIRPVACRRGVVDKNRLRPSRPTKQRWPSWPTWPTRQNPGQRQSVVPLVPVVASSSSAVASTPGRPIVSGCVIVASHVESTWIPFHLIRKSRSRAGSAGPCEPYDLPADQS
jgi:hypothetical protein